MRDVKLRDKFCNAVADKVLEYIVKEALAIDITRAIYDEAVKKYTQRAKRERTRQFELWNEEFRLLYEQNLTRRYNEMEKEVLGNIKYLYEIYNKGGRIKFDVNQWLFNRQKWRGTLAKDGTILAAAPIDAAGQQALDDLALGMSFNQVDPRAIEWIANNSKNAAWSITDTQHEKLKTSLMEGIADGESIPKIRARVAEIFNASRARATLIARTETLKASNRGGLIGMMQSGVVEGKQWLATMDNRTCPQCESMDGATMPLEKAYFSQGETAEIAGTEQSFDYEEIQHPPLHPDCRCTLLAIVREGTYNCAGGKEFRWPAKQMSVGGSVSCRLRPKGVRGHAGYEDLSHIEMREKIQADYLKYYGKELSNVEAEKYYKAVKGFTGSSSGDIRKAQMGMLNRFSSKAEYNRWLKVSNRLEDMMNFMPSWPKDQMLYRGMVGESRNMKEFLEAVKKLKPGDRMKLSSTTHWTSDVDTAKHFNGSVMYKLEGGINKSTSIRHLSDIATENEVMVSKDAILKVKKVRYFLNKDKYIIDLVEATG